ncbi:MAG: SDR family oxidoreductase [Rhizobiaceae bacterium]
MNLAIMPQSRSQRQNERLRGKVVVVTGSSAGVGRAVARRFAKAGASVALMAREKESLDDAAREVERAGARVIAVPTDMADSDAVFAAAQRVEEELGPIDIWINNAMTTVFSRVKDMEPEEYRRVTEVTYLGFVYGTMAALSHMKTRDRGLILHVGSALSYRGIPLQAAYCGAKHAIRGFNDALRTELLHDGSNIRVTMVQLPAVNTPQFDWARVHVDHDPRPVAPVFQPEAIADAIFEAANGDAPEYWLGFSTVKAILASMAFPAVVDRYLAKKGIKAQQTGSMVSASRRNNLFNAVRGLHRTRGSFGKSASSSVAMWSGNDIRAAAIGTLATVAAIAAAGILFQSTVRRRSR